MEDFNHRHRIIENGGMIMVGPVILVAGARPNFMKIAPIHKEMKNGKKIMGEIVLMLGVQYKRQKMVVI